MSKYIKLVLFVLVVLSGGFNLYLNLHQPAPAKVPDLPILVEADKYTEQVASYDFKKAKKYSTPENNRILDQEIRPKLESLARKNGMSKIKFKNIQFEKSLLVNESPDHQIVAERMAFDTPTRKNQVIYLRFEIEKQAKGYKIYNTTLIELK